VKQASARREVEHVALRGIVWSVPGKTAGAVELTGFVAGLDVREPDRGSRLLGRVCVLDYSLVPGNSERGRGFT
jgi:hypothetical protein